MKRTILPLILSTALAASAFDIDSLSVSIASASPSVEAARAQALAETEDVKASNILAGPEVEFEYKFAPAGIPDRWGFSIGQSFDFPGVYAARKRENRLRVSAFEYLYESELQERTFEVKLAIIRLLQARETLATVKAAAENIDKLCKKFNDALSRGETTILEVKKIELKQYDMSGRLTVAADEEKAAGYALNALCGCGFDVSALPAQGMYVPELAPFEYYRNAAIEHNPALAHYSTLARAEEASVRTAKNAAFPSVSISYVHDFEENTHYNGFGIGLSLPTWNNSHNVRAARARAYAADRIFTDNCQRQTAQFSTDYDNALRLQRELERGKRVFADKSYPEYLAKALDAGRITIFTYLTEYADYLEARLAYISLQADFARAESALSRYTR